MRHGSLVLCAFALTVACGDPDPVDDVDSGARADASTMTDASTTDDDASTTDDASTSDDDASTSDDDAGSDAGTMADADVVEGATFTEVYAILRMRCRGCHIDDNDGGLDLGGTRASAYETLRNDDRNTGGGCAAPDPLVTPGDASMSFLYLKVAGAPPSNCGDRMPRSGGVLTADQIETIRSWIAAGAMDD